MDGHPTQRRDHSSRYVRSATLSDVNQETQEISGTDIRPGREVRNVTVLLSSTPRGARLARLLAVDTLRGWGLPDEAAGHVVAELAANAATHGRLPGRSFRLTLYAVGATLRIEVTDTRGDRLPERQDPDGGAESGRGLLLVEALADRWGVSEGRFPRKTVWAELRLAPPEPAPTGSGGADD
ncbi:Histidine kinase-like ATPase domain-containing protein [Streptomyces prasinopilosus]|uniref:Histidine kinase-like ATPase domain-containing protein n=1 Tax=Streptomyces prasinopilosus TaxID=67344 RepID=A0A1G6NEQ5_9ACTN|nr:Histidine kinase-like ATPase domain-containing protein [Streptomyces prasinopilosus]